MTSLLYAKRPSELKLVFIDPKKTEVGGYSRLLNHYLAVTQDSESADDEKARAIVKTAEAADTTLKSLCLEMDNRYWRWQELRIYWNIWINGMHAN